MVFMLRPRSGPNQWVVKEIYDLTPATEVVEFTDTFDNLCQRLVAPVGEFKIYTSVDVMLTDQIDQQDHNKLLGFVPVPNLPDSAFTYLLPSRYCESDRFGDMATEIVANCEPGYAQVAAIRDWVRANIINIPLSSVYPVSAIEINQRREGVCRDLAHIAIALCRALCIPSRLVVGYLHGLEPMDIHAWFESFVGNQWSTFDPSTPQLSSTPPIKDARISIARGRDAADVAIYNQFGPLLLPLEMQVTVEPISS